MKSTSLSAMLMAGLALFCLSSRGYCATFGSGANTFNIEFVDITNPGNPADTTGLPNPAGSVSYSYRIGKYEISEDMITKANAEGGLAITVDARGADKPATSVTWNEAARFVNWLNLNDGSTPAYKFAINPGDANYAANVNNNIVAWSPSDPGYDANNIYRNSGAKYFLPSIDEWYKAAYYDAAAGVYYDYATGSNTQPTQVLSGTAAGTAVWGNPSNSLPADITQAGGLSPYGTMAQSGNVFEWQETDYDLVNGPVGNLRANRGGSWRLAPLDMLASELRNNAPGNQTNFIGFRVASVPEPGTLCLVALSALVSLACRKGRRS